MSKYNQKKVIKEMLDNGGYVKPAMEKAGYSNAYSRNPHKIVQTKSFQELLDKYLPDEDITKKHKELLEAQKVISANVYASGKDGKPVNDFIEVPDNQTQSKMVELGYKIKDKVPSQRTDITSGGEKIAPIFGGLSEVQDDDSDQEDIPAKEKN